MYGVDGLIYLVHAILENKYFALDKREEFTRWETKTDGTIQIGIQAISTKCPFYRRM